MSPARHFPEAQRLDGTLKQPKAFLAYLDNRRSTSLTATARELLVGDTISPSSSGRCEIGTSTSGSEYTFIHQAILCIAPRYCFEEWFPLRGSYFAGRETDRPAS